MTEENPFASPVGELLETKSPSSSRYELWGFAVAEWLAVRRWRFMILAKMVLLLDAFFAFETLENWRWDLGRLIILGTEVMLGLGCMLITFGAVCVKSFPDEDSSLSAS